MGVYRLILALLVLLSHVGIYFFGRNEGVFAVISFFLLSGFVMTAQIQKHYQGLGGIRDFYFDRLLRVYPQFLLYLLLSIVVVAVAHPRSHWISGVSFPKVVLNMLIFPLDFHWMIGLSDSVMMPQTWSLGLEACFYLLFPFLLHHRLRSIAFAVSLSIFVLAALHVVDPVIFGYRLIPGTLFIFLSGSLLYQPADHSGTYLLKLVWLLLAVLLWEQFAQYARPGPYMLEILCGFLFGLPMLFLLRRITSGAFDTLCGTLSYGVFLNHFLLIWTFQYLKVDLEGKPSILLFMGVSILLSWITYRFVEKPVIAYRNRHRDGREASTASLESVMPGAVDSKR